MASMMILAPSEAIRGSHNQIVTPHRLLQDASAEAVDGLPAPKEDKVDKVEKDAKDAPVPKKEDTKKSSKKDKALGKSPIKKKRKI